MITTRLDPPGAFPGRTLRGRVHRGRHGAVSVGADAGPGRGSGPGSPARAVMARAPRRARHAHDRPGEPRLDPPSPNGFDAAVPVAAPDVRAGA